MFGATSTGDIILLQPLDYEVRDVYVFRVHVTDGRVVSKSRRFFSNPLRSLKTLIIDAIDLFCRTIPL